MASIKNIDEEVLKLQSEYDINKCKEKYNYDNSKNFAYVHQPSISNAGLYFLKSLQLGFTTILLW